LNQQKRFIIETVIFASLAIAIVIIFSSTAETFQFKTESLLLAVLIFGIYLIVSGRVTELGFMDFQIKIKDAETKPIEIENQEASVFDIECDILDPNRTESTDKGSAIADESTSETRNKTSNEFTDQQINDKIDLKQKEENAEEKIKILKIWKKRYIYKKNALLSYLRRNDYVVFLDNEERKDNEGNPIYINGKLSGFAKSIDVIKKLQTSELESSKFMECIKNWDFINSETSEIIKIDAYIVRGMSRGQSLEMMNKKNFDVLPVIAANMIYVGIIDRHTIISHVIAELSGISPVVNQLLKYLKVENKR
jgi:hypothetical protein